MRAISVLQPWASLIACGAKRHLGVPALGLRGVQWRPANRGCGLGHRGLLAIHASRTVDTRAHEECREPAVAKALARAGYKEFLDQRYFDAPLEVLPKGCVIATAILGDIKPVAHFTPQERKRFFRYGDAKPQSHGAAWFPWVVALETPVEVNGRPRVFELPNIQAPELALPTAEELELHAPKSPCSQCGHTLWWQSTVYPAWCLCLTCRAKPDPGQHPGRELSPERKEENQGWFDEATAQVVNEELASLGERAKLRSLFAKGKSSP